MRDDASCAIRDWESHRRSTKATGQQRLRMARSERLQMFVTDR